MYGKNMIHMHEKSITRERILFFGKSKKGY